MLYTSAPNHFYIIILSTIFTFFYQGQLGSNSVSQMRGHWKQSLFFLHLLACIFCNKHSLINFWFLLLCCYNSLGFFLSSWKKPGSSWLSSLPLVFLEVSSCLPFLPFPWNSAVGSEFVSGFENRSCMLSCFNVFSTSIVSSLPWTQSTLK